MAKRELDIRLTPAGAIHESAGSRAARAAATDLGTIEGSSYSTQDGQPVSWAFHVTRGEEALILAGGDGAEYRVVLRVAPEHAFSGMLHAKALVGFSVEPLEPGVIALIEHPAEDADWFVDSFLVVHDRIEGMGERDVFAVALHVAEIGLGDEQADQLVRARTPALVSSPDPDATHPSYRRWCKLVRSMRRLCRLKELAAPALLVDNEIALARRTWDARALADLARWPPDLRDAARELGFTQ